MNRGFQLIHKNDLVRQIDAIALAYRNKPDALEVLSILRMMFSDDSRQIVIAQKEPNRIKS